MKLDVKTTSKRFISDPLVIAFLIPFLSMLCVMLFGGYEPFGNDRALLYSDEYHQYYPFFLAFRKSLLSGESLLYSWNVGMGMDYLGLIAYYLASPLNLLSVLVPESLVLEYFALLSPIKLGLAGLFFAIFLKKIFNVKDHSISIFGAIYALCAWALGYQWNVMWLDTFALLPLVALGTVELLRDKKVVLYTVALCLSVLSNYYIGFFTCIFVLLLFICYQICRCNSLVRFLLDLGRIALFSILAIGMTAFLELPALMALQDTQSAVNTFPEGFQMNIVGQTVYQSAKDAWESYKVAKEAGASFMDLTSLWLSAVKASFLPILEGMRQVAGNLGAALEPTFKEGLPNVYCGVGSVILAFLFLTSGQVKLRDKLCCVGLLLFFILSFLLRQLDYIWHGFHFTNMIPYRFSFLFSFVMLYMAYRAWLLRYSFQIWQIIIAVMWSAAIILSGNEADEMLYLAVNLVFIVLYCAGLVAFRLIQPKPRPAAEEGADQLLQDPAQEEALQAGEAASVPEEPIPALDGEDDPEVPVYQIPASKLRSKELPSLQYKKLATLFFAGIMVMELVLNVINFGVRFPYTTVTNYPKGTTYTQSMINYMKQREEGSDFYRAEVTHTQTLNDGALNGYNGISTFTSSANVRVTEFMAMLGYGAKDTYNRYCFEESSPVANLFLNLKYMIERDGDVEENSYFDVVHSYGDVYLLENNAYLPLGFLAEDTLADCSLEQIEENAGTNNFLRQNYLFRAATGLEDSVWNMVYGDCLSITGSKSLELTRANNATGYTIYATKENAATLRYTYTIDRAGFLCLDMNMSKRNSFRVYKNNQELYSESLSLPQMLAVCEVEPGDTIYLDIICNSNTDRGVVLIQAAQINDQVFREGYEILSSSTWDLTDFSTTRVQGTIDCGRDGLMYTSIPYDGNWVVEVDGQEAEPVLVGDAMMAVELTAGTHEICFRYKNDAFTIGVLVSVLCLLIFLAILFVPRYLRQRRPGKYEKEN